MYSVAYVVRPRRELENAFPCCLNLHLKSHGPGIQTYRTHVAQCLPQSSFCDWCHLSLSCEERAPSSQEPPLRPCSSMASDSEMDLTTGASSSGLHSDIKKVIAPKPFRGPLCPFPSLPTRQPPKSSLGIVCGLVSVQAFLLPYSGWLSYDSSQATITGQRLKSSGGDG